MLTKKIFVEKNSKFVETELENIKGLVHIIEDWEGYKLDYGIINWADYVVKSRETKKRLNQLEMTVAEMRKNNIPKEIAHTELVFFSMLAGLGEGFVSVIDKIIIDVYGEI